MSIRVLICDDDPIVREALAGYLAREDDIDIVRSVETAETALESLEEVAPDLVLMDLVLPGIDGIAATRTIRERCPDTPVLVLTTFGTNDQVKEAIGAGASGFLLKSTTAAALTVAVRAAVTGAGTVITPELASHLATATSSDLDGGEESRAPVVTDAVDALGLTDREIEVLTRLCAAESNAGIATQLQVSESTVKTHISSLMAKLNCTSRLQVAVRAFERGLVQPPTPRS